MKDPKHVIQATAGVGGIAVAAAGAPAVIVAVGAGAGVAAVGHGLCRLLSSDEEKKLRD